MSFRWPANSNDHSVVLKLVNKLYIYAYENISLVYTVKNVINFHVLADELEMFKMEYKQTISPLCTEVCIF